MRMDGNRESSNVEDMRGSGGGGGGFGLGGRSIGIGTIVIALVGGAIFGINPLTILGILTGGGGPAPQVQQGPAQRPPADDTMAKFVSTVLADTEDVWAQLFKQGGASYVNPSWCCSAARCAPAAARASRPWGRSIAQPTRRSTSTWTSTKPSRIGWARPAISPRPT